jgi:hypothetical protein
MFADLLPPPTLAFDWYTLGFPSGLIAFLAVCASIVTMAVVLARRRVHVGWILLLCAVLFVAADLVTYYVGINLPRPPRPRTGEFRLEKSTKEDAKN